MLCIYLQADEKKMKRPTNSESRNTGGFRLSPNEVARLVKEEREKRRKLRIVQVKYSFMPVTVTSDVFYTSGRELLGICKLVLYSDSVYQEKKCPHDIAGPRASKNKCCKSASGCQEGERDTDKETGSGYTGKEH